jgi:hypothetical protein
MERVIRGGQRSSRLQNLLLLLLRGLLITVAVLLLAGPTCHPETPRRTLRGPVVCALVLDDSLSTSYRRQFDAGQTLLDELRSHAEAFLESADSWPVGSQLAIVRPHQHGRATEFTASRAALNDALRESADGSPHAHPLGRAIRQAVQLLREAEQRDKRLVIFTDGTASAWRDVRPTTLTTLPELQVEVFLAAPEDPANLGIVDVRFPQRVWPAAVPLPVSATIASEAVDGKCWLTAREGDDVLARVGPIAVSEDSQIEINLQLPSRSPGAHAITLTLEPEDLLDADQLRFLAWETGPRPHVWLVQDSTRDSDADLGQLIIRNLLAPELLDDARQRLVLHTIIDTNLHHRLQETVSDPSRAPGLIVVGTGVVLPLDARQSLRQTIERGATTLLVPSSDAALHDWPGLRSLLSEALPVQQTLAATVTLRWQTQTDTPATADLAAEFAQCRVRQRLRIDGLHDETRVLARFTDDIPAVIERPVGDGRLIALATSPDPQWSDLGIRAAAVLTWLHQLVDESLGPPVASANLLAGELTSEPFLALPAAGLVQVTRPANAAGEKTWLRLTNGQPQDPWPTAHAGIHDVRPASGGSVARYAVNWPADETDLTAITPAGLKRALGTDALHVRRPAQTEQRSAGGLSAFLALWNPAWVIGLLAVALFLTELWLAAHQRLRAAAQKKGAASPEEVMRTPKGDTTASTQDSSN